MMARMKSFKCYSMWYRLCDQGLKRLNQLTVIRSPVEASPFILHMVKIITNII